MKPYSASDLVSAALRAETVSDAIAGHPERPAILAKVFLTSREWAVKWKLTFSTAQAKTSAMANTGQMERRIYAVELLSGRRYPVPHYRLK